MINVSKFKSKMLSMMFFLVVGLFTLSFTSCNDDDVVGDYDYSCLLHTWEMTASSTGQYPYNNVDDVVYDMSSTGTLRVFVSPDNWAASNYGMSDSQIYFVFNVGVGYKTYSDYKGRLVLSGIGEWAYEVSGSTLRITTGDGWYEFTLSSLSNVNYSTPEAFIDDLV